MSARTDEPNLSRSVVSGPWCLIESDPGDYDGYKVLSTIDFGSPMFTCFFLNTRLHFV